MTTTKCRPPARASGSSRQPAAQPACTPAETHTSSQTTLISSCFRKYITKFTPKLSTRKSRRQARVSMSYRRPPPARCLSYPALLPDMGTRVWAPKCSTVASALRSGCSWAAEPVLALSATPRTFSHAKKTTADADSSPTAKLIKMLPKMNCTELHVVGFSRRKHSKVWSASKAVPTKMLYRPAKASYRKKA